ncbi:MAG TPA: DUF72 domain-containing protein [Kofleriaceae bacterium]|jgi:uncharacterized protein YecE (DUF72 family)|nr:DUF72 domain-containing protein [Kofleriaceae bacterium]
MARIYSGTSGWVYRTWREHLYSDTPIKRWLQVASNTFSSLEINGSFYRQISPATYRRWRQETPAEFRCYSSSSLQRWATDARRWRDQGRDVFVYFDNDAEGHAVRNARTFAQLAEHRAPAREDPLHSRSTRRETPRRKACSLDNPSRQTRPATRNFRAAPRRHCRAVRRR